MDKIKLITLLEIFKNICSMVGLSEDEITIGRLVGFLRLYDENIKVIME